MPMAVLRTCAIGPHNGSSLKRAPRWADVEASEDDEEEALVPAPPTVDDSYLEAPVPGLEDSRSGLNHRLAQAAELQGGPQDFTSLLQSAPATPEAPTTSGRWQPNIHAPEFIPTLTMACPLVGVCQVLVEEPTPEKVPQSCSGLLGDKRGRGAGSGKRRPPALQVPAQKRTKSGERGSAVAQGEMPEATEEDWQHRLEMREKAVRVGKKTREYQWYAELRLRKDREEGEPMTPDPADRSISKRRWKYEVQQWRVAIKQRYAEEGQGSVMSAEEWQSMITGTTEEPESHSTLDGDDGSDV